MAGPKVMLIAVAALAAGAITFWSYGDSPESSAPPSEATAATTTEEVAGPQPATADDFVLQQVSEDDPHIPMGDGTRLPPLNGVTDTTGLRSVEGPPQIMRLYGQGRIIPRGTSEYAELLEASFNGEEIWGTRQLVLLDIDLVQTSCGFGVPLFDYQGERQSLDRWVENKSAEDLKAYQRERNMVSMDGFPTGLFEDT